MKDLGIFPVKQSGRKIASLSLGMNDFLSLCLYDYQAEIFTPVPPMIPICQTSSRLYSVKPLIQVKSHLPKSLLLRHLPRLCPLRQTSLGSRKRTSLSE